MPEPLKTPIQGIIFLFQAIQVIGHFVLYHNELNPQNIVQCKENIKGF